jgi:hypothetical protein
MPLDLGEGVVISGKHHILVGYQGGAVLAQSVLDGTFANPLIYDEVPFLVSKFTGLQGELPPNVMLITRSLLYDEPSTTLLIQLGHQYVAGKDEKFLNSVEVDLSVCAPPGYTISNVVEVLTLSGNQEHSVWLEKRLD